MKCVWETPQRSNTEGRLRLGEFDGFGLYYVVLARVGQGWGTKSWRGAWVVWPVGGWVGFRVGRLVGRWIGRWMHVGVD